MHDRTNTQYPVEVHTEGQVSTRVRTPKVYILLDKLFPPEGRFSRRRMLLTGGLTAVACVIVVLLWQGIGDGSSIGSGGDGHHGVSPISTEPPWTDVESEATPDGVTPPAASVEPEPTETVEPSVTHEGTEGGDETESNPSATDGEPTAAATDEVSREPDTGEVTEPPTEPSPEESATVPAEPETDPRPAETEPGTERETESETEAVTTAPAETVPDGCFPYATLDMSDPDRGAGYIINTVGSLPQSLPTTPFPNRETPPTVLLVNTHPYEGYSDGRLWYDPTAGGLAQTDTPNDPDGTVALSAALTRSLRGMGVTVIHLRVAVTAGESAGEIYDRTEAMIRYYCRLYPDIGLVLDLRRSAELTADREILRTAGSFGGQSCAQIRISVSGGKTPTVLGHDLAAALALRESLWAIEPSVSRPVWVKSGKGLIPDLTDVRVLTLELGAAGNSYAEAQRLISPLARAIGELLEK